MLGNEYPFLKKAFLKVAEDEIIQLPSEEEINWEFSLEFQRKMWNLIQNPKYRSPRRFTFRKGLLVAAIVALFISSAMSVGGVRTPVAEMLWNVFHTHSDILYEYSSEEESMPTAIEQEFTLTDVPEGYKEVQHNVYPGAIFHQWQNDEGQMIELAQQILSGAHSIDTENAVMEEVLLGEQKILIAQKSPTILAVWTFNGYSFQLILPDSFGQNDVLRFVQNIESSNFEK